MTKKINRREFLKWQMAAAISSSSFFPLLGNLSNAHSATISDEYKALVCVFLLGGNDSFNMVIPQSTNAYNSYATARQSLAVPRDLLLPINPASYNDETDYGFHPKMFEVRQLFNDRKLSIIANVGMLSEPITKEEYKANVKIKPPQLFSHSSQKQQWMKAKANMVYPFGWAGRMADLMYPNPDFAPNPAVNISPSGVNLWQTGKRYSTYDIPVSGVHSLTFPSDGGGNDMEQAYQAIYNLEEKSSHTLVSHYAKIQQQSNDLTKVIEGALQFAPTPSKSFDKNSQLAQQLEMVVKLIAVRNNFGNNTGRQMFFVGFRGWDTHKNQNEEHPKLLQQLSQSLNTFYAALEELGMENQVTTFTASEFGRSLTPNSSGTDHGWGGHNLVMGGSVNGGDIFGTMPKIEINSPDAVERVSRIIPTTSVEQYSATLASWFGLSEQEVNTVFPNLDRFDSNDLGFMS
jgi:uncharacterized protein (DUF1501 family)